MRFLRSCVVVLLVGSMACGAKAPRTLSNARPPEPAVSAPTKGAKGWTVELVDGSVSLEGTVRDVHSKEPLEGVSFVITGGSLVGEQITISDAAGRYTLSDLRDGTYTVKSYYADLYSEIQFTLTRGRAVKLTLEIDQQLGSEVIVD